MYSDDFGLRYEMTKQPAYPGATFSSYFVNDTATLGYQYATCQAAVFEDAFTLQGTSFALRDNAVHSNTASKGTMDMMKAALRPKPDSLFKMCHGSDCCIASVGTGCNVASDKYVKLGKDNYGIFYIMDYGGDNRFRSYFAESASSPGNYAALCNANAGGKTPGYADGFTLQPAGHETSLP